MRSAFVICLLALAACAREPRTYIPPPGVTQEQSTRDRAACEAQAAMIPNDEIDPWSPIWAMESKGSHFMDNCMRAKGYVTAG